MAAGSSIAVWCSHRNPINDAQIQVHFNYWRIAGDKNFIGTQRGLIEDFAEVGLWLQNSTSVDEIFIYIPIPISHHKIKDCAPYFSQVDIAQGIFNEILKSISYGPPGPSRIELSKPETPFCRVHRFVQGADHTIDPQHLSVTAEGEGTILTIKRRAIDDVRHELPAGCPVYFRLRIYMPKGEKNVFVRTITPLDRSLQSGFEEVEYIDFRLNEARTLPERIESLMRADPQSPRVAFNLVAFLAAVPIATDLTDSNATAHKKRLLEDDLWNKYVPGGIPKGMMVYHWRKREVETQGPIQDFSGFVKLRTRRSDRYILTTYLSIAFVFGIFGNLVASYLERLWSVYWNAS